MHLNQSLPYKQARIGSSAQEELEEVRFHDEEYLGLFLAAPKVTLAHLQSVKEKLESKLQLYCPTFSTESVKLVLFPQIFVK